MIRNFVADTTALISFFCDVFERDCVVSRRALGLIEEALRDPSDVRLSIPSIVFVEIFDKWFDDEELAAKIYYEVFFRLDSCPNVEIKPLEREVIEELLSLRDDEINLENHDKIILASAMMLRCPVITSDSKLYDYNAKYSVLPAIIT